MSFLEWRINEMEIQPNFDIGDSAPMEVTSGQYTLYLDSISVNNVDRVANMTTRLHANLSSLSSGDRLSCEDQSRIAANSTLNYTIRGMLNFCNCCISMVTEVGN